MRAGVRPRLAWPPWGTRPPSAPRPAGVGSSSRVSSQHFISHSTRNEGLPTEKGPTSADFGLYLITDSAMARRRGLPLETVVEEAIRGGVTMVQVREKASSTREFVHLSRRIKKVTARHGVPLIINDRVDVALAIGADGVHVGQDDMEAAVARSLLTKAGGRGRRERLLLGVTVADEVQARAAELAGADYLGTSAVFETATKTDGYVIGPERVARIGRATSLPLVAVGGVKETNAAQLVGSVHEGGAGATGIGVVSAIINAESPRAAAERLASVLSSSLPRYSQELAIKAAETLARVRTQRPLIQNVTNYVVMNDTANAILQAGGSPVMAHENVEMTRHAHAVVLNMGTLDDFWLQQMQSIGQEANRQGIPVVFDPVGAGATAYRTGSAVQLLETLHTAVLRGNPGEITALHNRLCTRTQHNGPLVRGVDSVNHSEGARTVVREMSRAKDYVVAMTGKADVISDGERLLEVHNNHMLLGQITGSGCMATSIISAFVAALSEPTHRPRIAEATAAALAYYCHAAERAGKRIIAEGLGPASFRTALLDELFHVTPNDLEENALILEAQ